MRSMSYSSPRHLCYWALLSGNGKSDAAHNRALTKVALQGLVLDCSLGTGVTDQTFLIPWLDVQNLKCCVARLIF
jgi:hypothetical protein